MENLIFDIASMGYHNVSGVGSGKEETMADAIIKECIKNADANKDKMCIFDFCNSALTALHRCEYLVDLLKRDNTKVKINKVTNGTDEVGLIRGKLIACGVPRNDAISRVEGIEVVHLKTAVKLSRVEKQRLEDIASIRGITEFIQGADGKRAVVRLDKLFPGHSIAGLGIISYLSDVVVDFKEKDHIDTLVLDMRRTDNEAEYLTVFDAGIAKFVDCGKKCVELGIKVELVWDEKRVADYTERMGIGNTKGMPVEDKIKIIQDHIEEGTPIIYSEFGKGKSDDLGRKNCGVASVIMIGIYRGITNGKVKVQLFRESELCTYLEYQIEHNGEIHNQLKSVYREIEVESLGFKDYFIGTHFNMEILRQEGVDDCTAYILDDGNFRIANTLICEYIKAILDDYNIDYNKKVLDQLIEEDAIRMAEFIENGSIERMNKYSNTDINWEVDDDE